MRPMPVSRVVKTDEEVRDEMKADASVSKAEIAAVMAERKANAEKAQEHYDKRTSAPFHAPAKSSQAPEKTVWDKE